MLEAKGEKGNVLSRQLRNNVVRMRHAIVAAFVLVSDELAYFLFPDPRCAVGVERGVRAQVTDFGCGDSCHCATEAMARDDEFVRRVGGLRAFERVKDGGSSFSPAFVEAAADATGGANVGSVDGDEADVGSPVGERVGAAE